MLLLCQRRKLSAQGTTCRIPRVCQLIWGSGCPSQTMQAGRPGSMNVCPCPLRKSLEVCDGNAASRGQALMVPPLNSWLAGQAESHPRISLALQPVTLSLISLSAHLLQGPSALCLSLSCFSSPPWSRGDSHSKDLPTDATSYPLLREISQLPKVKIKP